MILPKPECPHGQLIENRSTPDAQIRILEFMHLSKYHPSHHFHSVESAPKSYSRSPLGVLDHSHPHTGHGPTLVMALMQTAFLPDVCSLPCASVTQIMQRARWLLYIIYLMSSAGIKQTYLIFPCVCTFSSVFGANLLLLLYFMLHFTSHQFALPYLCV